ncbi:MAG: hypothetical protein JXJ30_02860 [Halothiobacillaceae bacterium]|nr:hypothetical protein [Halothiobacillaceae bacterium]
MLQMTVKFRNGQSGIALVIALILLLAITLIGLASIRGTTLQEKMSANLQDRDLAFQAAEAALRAGEEEIATNTSGSWRDCSAGASCLAEPAPSDSNWESAGLSSGGWAAGDPEYLIEYMGQWADPNSNTGVNLSGAGTQYGAQGTTTMIPYYRVTARSASPTATQGRAVVVLQSWVRR